MERRLRFLQRLDERRAHLAQRKGQHHERVERSTVTDTTVLKLMVVDIPVDVTLLGNTLIGIGQVYPTAVIKYDEQIESLIIEVRSVHKHYGTGGGETA